MIKFDKEQRKDVILISVIDEEDDYEHIIAEIVIGDNGKPWLLMKEFLIDYDVLLKIVNYMGEYIRC